MRTIYHPLIFFLALFTLSHSSAQTGEALDFDGVDDHVVLSSIGFPFGNSARTVEAWIKTTQGGTIFSYGLSPGFNSPAFIISIGGDGRVNYTNGSTNNNLVTFPRIGRLPRFQKRINDGEWHHVAVSIAPTSANDAEITIFVDGLFDASLSTAGSPINTVRNNNDAAVIGGLLSNVNSFSSPFEGTIDEVRVWDIAKTEAQVAAQKDAPLTGAETGLVVYYDFNQGSAGLNNAGVTSATDGKTGGTNSGNLLNFTLNGATSNWVSPGFAPFVPPVVVPTGRSLAFDGVDDHVRLSSIKFPFGNDARTIEAWFKTTDPGTIFSYGAFPGFNSPAVVISVGQDGRINYINGSQNNNLTRFPRNGNLPEAQKIVDDGFWHHVALTMSPTSPNDALIRIYVDGILDAEISTAGSPIVTTPLFETAVIGAYLDGPADLLRDPFAGNIDEVRVWDFEKTLPQIQSQKNNELSGNEAGLVAYFDFNQGQAGQDNNIPNPPLDILENRVSGSVAVDNGGLFNFALDGANSNWVGDQFDPTNIPPAPTITGEALNFDGVDDHVRFSTAGFPFGTSSRTVEAWFKTSQTGPSTIFAYGAIPGFNSPSFIVQMGGDGRINLLTGSASRDLNRFPDNTFLPNTQAIVNDGNWHHVACTYEQSTSVLAIFVDGEFDAFKVISGPFNTVPGLGGVGTIGGFLNNQAQLFDEFEGSIDEVRVWNFAKTEAQVQAQKDDELNGDEAGLVSYFNFNNGLAAGDNTTPPVNVLPSGLDGAIATQNGGLYNFALNGASSNWVGPGFAPFTPPASPNTGRALDFDGVDDQVRLSSNGLPDRFETRTIEAWIKTTSGGVIFSYGTDPGFNGPYFTISVGGDGGINVTTGSQGRNLTSPNDPVNDGNWHHIAITFGSNTIAAYVDGVFDGSRNTGIFTGTGRRAAIIGATIPNRDNVQSGFFQGQIDELRVWNVAKNSQQINALKDQELTGTEPGLVLYYDFNQGDASNDNISPVLVNRVFDKSPREVHGSLVGFALTGSSSNWVSPGAPVSSGNITLNAPSGLISTESTFFLVPLTWTDNSSNEDGFRIYRDGVLISLASDTDDAFDPANPILGEVKADVTSIVDTVTGFDQTYTYEVRAFIKGTGGNPDIESTSSSTATYTMTSPIQNLSLSYECYDAGKDSLYWIVNNPNTKAVPFVRAFWSRPTDEFKDTLFALPGRSYFRTESIPQNPSTSWDDNTTGVWWIDEVLGTEDDIIQNNIDLTTPCTGTLPKLAPDAGGIFGGVLRVRYAGPTSVANTYTSDQVRIGPNPFHSNLNIYVSEPMPKAEISILNLMGQQVYQAQRYIGSDTDLKLDGLSPGVYLLELRNEGRTFTQKIVKQ